MLRLNSHAFLHYFSFAESPNFDSWLKSSLMGRERSSPKANLTLFSAGRGGEAGFCRFKAARNGGSRVKGLISCLLTPGHLLSTKTIRKGIRGMFSGLPQQPSWHLFLLFWFRFCYETRKQNSSETVGRQLPSRWRLRREMSGTHFSWWPRSLHCLHVRTSITDIHDSRMREGLIRRIIDKSGWGCAGSMRLRGACLILPSGGGPSGQLCRIWAFVSVPHFTLNLIFN